METHLTPIQQVHPQTRSWTAKVQVVEKCFPHPSRNSSRRFQKLILADSEGTRVQATIFGSDIDLFRNTLKEYHKYYVSNAIVRYAHPDHKIVENNNQWIINGATLIEQVICTENEEIVTPAFTPFTELSLHANKDSTIDIIAVAIRTWPPKHIETQTGGAIIQELLLTTKELKPILLTMWDNFIDMEGAVISRIIHTWPIVICTRIRVTTTRDKITKQFGVLNFIRSNMTGPLSLSTKSKSCIMINPEIPATNELRSWRDAHKEELDTLTLVSSNQLSHYASNAPTTQNVTTVYAANQLESMEPFWIHASAHITNFSQKFWYVACNKCHKAINIHCGKVYDCSHCNQTKVTAEPRCRFDVELRDDTGHITTNFFGQVAEKLFPFTAEDLKNNTDEDGLTDKDFLHRNLTTDPRFLHIKPYSFQIGDSTRRRHTIMAIKDTDMAESSSTSQ